MELKFKRFKEDMELGKQRENKLMFFLYVLKEEKNAPVTEVFEKYIKPIDTSKFATDYGDDYRKVLKKIKNESRYEKLYNKAIKKMRLLNGNKEYKSDTCLPVYTGGIKEPRGPRLIDKGAQQQKIDQFKKEHSIKNTSISK